MKRDHGVFMLRIEDSDAERLPEDMVIGESVLGYPLDQLDKPTMNHRC